MLVKGFLVFVAAVGAAMLAGGLAASMGSEGAGLVAGFGAFALTASLIAIREREREQEAESKKQ